MTLITLLPMIFGGSINPIFALYTVTNRLKGLSLVLLLCQHHKSEAINVSYRKSRETEQKGM